MVKGIAGLIEATKSFYNGFSVTVKEIFRRPVTLIIIRKKLQLAERFRGAPAVKAFVGDHPLDDDRGTLQEYNGRVMELHVGGFLAPCESACPAHTNARGYVAAVASGEFERALAIIRERAPFAASLGRICHHPCEISCRRGYFDEPVSIRNLKRFAADACEHLPYPLPPAKTSGKRVAIIGSGPAGLSAAADLAKAGHDVTVFEKNASGGGALLTGVPAYRLPREKLAWDVGYVASLGVEIKTGVEVGKDIELNEIVDSHDAVIIANGLQISRGLPIPGADAKKGILLALPFLKAANFGQATGIGKRVVVVGGGNVAIDVARCAVRAGAEKVYEFCLEGPAYADMPAHNWEIEEALEEGVEIHPSFGPKEVLTEGGRVIGMAFKRCLAVFDSEGRFNPSYDESEVKTVKVDTVIFAIGQGSENKFIEGVCGLNERGLLVVDHETQQTSNPKVFSAGEVITGPGSAIGSIVSGHEAAISADRYLKGLDLKEGRVKIDIKTEGPYQPNEPTYIEPERRRAVMPKVAPEVRVKDFREIELGFTEEEAVAEAFRSLSCRSEMCVGCSFCQRICPDFAISVERTKPGDGPRRVTEYKIDLSKCMFCGLCADQCPTKALIMSKEFELATYDKEKVVLEAERMAGPPEREGEMSDVRS
ncbi:MAG: FAD-dependent oxidoreductase [Actinobacteria bacterium]|nr:FAD-dependent oxidoreductase [Actinomycetota bacterium]